MKILQMALKPSERQLFHLQRHLLSPPLTFSPCSSSTRHEEAGVRWLDMARGLLHLSQLRAADWLQVLHTRQGRALLRGLLRGQVRPSLHAL